MRPRRPEDIPGRLRRLFALAVGAAYSRRDRARLMLEGPPGVSEGFKRWLLRLKQAALVEVAALVQAGVEQGSLRPVDPLATAPVIGGTLPSLVAATLWTPEHMPAGAAGDRSGANAEGTVERIFEVLWGALAPRED